MYPDVWGGSHMEELTEASESRQFRRQPRIPAGMLARPRLTRRLDSWSDVTVVHGMAGTGKSTLAAMWAESVTPLFWCEPEFGKLPIEAIEAFATCGAGALVIDKAEDIEDSEYAHLGRVINNAPKLRVVVLTTKPRTIVRLSQVLEAALDVITARDLSFTLEELRDAKVLASDHEREELLRQTDGLAVAVRAKIEDARQSVSGARERFRHRLREGLKAHPGWYESGLRLALLPRVNREILVSWQVPQELLDELVQTGAADWNDNWLSLNGYIRGLLLEDAEQLLSFEERHRLVAKAVRTTLIERDPVSALRAAFMLKDLDLAAEVVFSSLLELLESRDDTYQIFTDVPTSSLREHPVLIVTLVLLSNTDPQTRPRALQLLAAESLFLRLRPGRGTHLERVVYRVFEAVALRLAPAPVSPLPRVRRAFHDLGELDEVDMEKLGRLGPMLYVHLGISAFYLRDYALAKHCFELADAMHAEAGRNDRVDPLSLRGGLAALMGDLGAARRLLDKADRAIWPAGWRDTSPADFFNLGQAILAVEAGDAQLADNFIQAAGPVEEILEHWALFALVQARRDRLAGEAELGLIRIKQIRETRGGAPGTPLARSFLDAAEAELLLHTGNFESARRIAERSAKHSATCRVVLAQTELALGRSAVAARHAQTVIKASFSTLRTLLDADLVLLCVASRNGFEHEVRTIAKRVALRLAETGLRAALRNIASQDKRAVSEALVCAGVDSAVTSLVSTEFVTDRPESAHVISLTPREQTVLEALAETPALDEIAERLFVSRNTVKSQLASIYRKLGVPSRDAALTRAAVLGLLD